jgi:pyruvate,orthophosphate dikinase
MISIDGSTGHVYLGELAVVPSPVSNYLENGLAVASATDDAEISALVKAVDRILKHADSVRRLNIRTNADTAEDAKWARNLGAEGIGLCRTEHMFLGDRRVLIERVILADNTLDRTAALDALLPMQQKDFEELFEAMDDLATEVESGDVVLVTHQQPIWMVHRKVSGAKLAHNPKQRRCGLSSITSFEKRDGVWVEVDVVVGVGVEFGDRLGVGLGIAVLVEV